MKKHEEKDGILHITNKTGAYFIVGYTLAFAIHKQRARREKPL